MEKIKVTEGQMNNVNKLIKIEATKVNLNEIKRQMLELQDLGIVKKRALDNFIAIELALGEAYYELAKKTFGFIEPIEFED